MGGLMILGRFLLCRWGKTSAAPIDNNNRHKTKARILYVRFIGISS